jgi:hypothetical protein
MCDNTPELQTTTFAPEALRYARLKTGFAWWYGAENYWFFRLPSKSV